MSYLIKFLKIFAYGCAGFLLLGLVTTLGVYIYLAPKLPSIETLKDVQLQVPLRIYTSDAKLLAEFGEMRRTPLKFDDTPPIMVNAILAAEDARFFTHPGVDYQGILRAVINLLKTGEKSQGGSTITMQVARNFFLSRQKTYLRKLNEILLALKIERELSKKDILELYLNKIYLGNRAYGIQAAAQVYYGTTADQLSIAQLAMIAGLPKAPSRYNPIVNPERALIRRNYVLNRMYQLNYLDDLQYDEARAEPVSATLHALTIEIEAPYVAEMVRSEMLDRYGEEAYISGFKVITSVDSRLQQAANKAQRKALLDYDRRHGFRGVIKHVDLVNYPVEKQWTDIIDEIPATGGLQPGLVIALEDQSASVLLQDGNAVLIPWAGIEWARPYIDDNHRGPAPELATDVLKQGDVIYVQPMDNAEWYLAQIPTAEGALVAVRPDNGSITALVGGFDFYHSKFNRVIQAKRQPGSIFKPFIYSAALEKGFTAASIINDAPVVFDDPGLESEWRPENYSGKFYGPTRLREALVKSRNLVSIRLLRSIGIKSTIDYVSRFGFNPADLPRNLSLALGSGAITPLELAGGYAVFANGGYRVTPYFIERIIDSKNEIIFHANPGTACPSCDEDDAETTDTLPSSPDIMEASLPDDVDEPGQQLDPFDLDAGKPAITPAERIVSEENVYLMSTMMRDVIQHGTGRRARQLGRSDLAGKTGTTNDQRDAWFSGFNGDIVTVSWVGFDKARPLGNSETGARAALPMWITFMAEATRGTPETTLERPPGLVSVRIDPETGLLADANNPSAIFETFRTEDVPTQYARQKLSNGGDQDIRDKNVREQLF